MSPVSHRYVNDAKHASAEPYGAAEFLLLAESLRKVPEELRRRVAYRLRPIGERTLAAARARASWSSRIPGAISLQVRFKGKDPGLIITVDHRKAPHGRPFEGILQPQFRHPVFGDIDNWVAQSARPFVWPAVVETQQDVAAEVDEAIDETLAAAGFH